MAITTHRGSCHCGRVSFRVELDLSEPGLTCNCSICSRSGSILAFVPESRFELQSGEADLTEYQFGKRNIHHLFCSTCGIRSFSRSNFQGEPTVAVNLRCIEDLDPAQLETTFFDGKAL